MNHSLFAFGRGWPRKRELEKGSLPPKTSTRWRRAPAWAAGVALGALVVLLGGCLDFNLGDPPAGGVGDNVYLDTIPFNDNALRDCVLSQGENRAQGIAELHCEGWGIFDLTGVEYLVFTHTMAFQNNQISSLNALGGLTDLEVLDLSYNLVNDVSPLGGLTGLVSLSLDWQYDGMGISNASALGVLTQLQDLRIEGNQVSDISWLAGLTSLTTLWIGSNPVADFTPLAGLSGMEELSLHSLGLADSNVAFLTNSPNLTLLNVGWNNLTTLGFLSGLTQLTELYVDGNSFPTTATLSPIANLTALQRLGLSSVAAGLPDISFLSGWNLPSLVYLDLSGNTFTNLAPVTSFPGLEEIQLNGTNVTDFTPLASLPNLRFLGISGVPGLNISFMSGLTGLTDAYLGNNLISDLTPLAGLTTLQFLDLYDNDIQDVTPLAGLSNLGGLGLERNPVTTGVAGLANLTNLYYLNLDGNNAIPCGDVTTVVNALGPSVIPPQLCGLPLLLVSAVVLPDANLDTCAANQAAGAGWRYTFQVTDLYCDGLAITDLSEIGILPGLVNLSLTNNSGITDLSPLADLSYLQTLALGPMDMAPAPLASPLAALPDLFSLTFFNMMITDVSEISALTSLNFLDLSANQIVDVTPLSGLTNLGTLYLTSNRITTGVAALAALPALGFVDLTANLNPMTMEPSAPCLEVEALAAAVPGGVNYDGCAFSPPTGLSSTPGSPGQITLSWNVQPGAGGYNIYYATAPGPYPSGTLINVPGGTASSRTLTGLTSGVGHYVRMTSVTPGGNEGQPNTTDFNVTPP